MVKLSRLLSLSAFAASTCYGQGGTDTNQLAGKEKTQEASASRALYEFDYVKWEDKHQRTAPLPMPDKVRETLLKKGNTLDDINRAESYRQKQSLRAGQEKWEKGKITVRRMGDMVSIEKRMLAVKYGNEEWRTLESIRQETAANLSLKGLKLPKGFTESVIRDYSNGALISTVGRFGPAGRVDADMDKEATYSFPSTIGAGVLAIPLAGLPVSKFCDIRGFKNDDAGLAWATKNVVREGHTKKQTYEVDAKTSKLVTFTESVGNVPYYTVDVSDYQTMENGALVAGKVLVKFQNGSSNAKSQELTYELKRAEFGDAVDIKDMKSMGPVGTKVLDNRLRGPKAVPYVMGTEPKSDAEVKQIAGQAFMHEVPPNNAPTQLLFVGSGGLMVCGAAYWAVRSRKSTAS